MKFKMHPGTEAALEAMAAEAISNRFQPVLDTIHTEYAGHPTDTIKPVLAKRWAAASDAARITDPELTNIAQAISDGYRVLITSDGTLRTV